MLCSGLLTGFQALRDTHTQQSAVAQAVQPANNTTAGPQPTSPTPNPTNEQAPAQHQPLPLTKPQPLPILPSAQRDLINSLDNLVTKQTVQLTPYIPFIQEISIGIDQLSLIKNLWHVRKKLKNQYIDYAYEWAGTISILWKGNIQVVGNMGYAALYPPTLKFNTHAYRTQGFYGSLGIGYVSHYNETNHLYIGLHYNRAHFTNYTLTLPANKQVISRSLTASWLGAVISAESRLFEKIALYGGCRLHMQWLYHYTPFNQAKNYVIPGYGLNANKLNLGLNLYILYKFSFIERMIKLT